MDLFDPAAFGLRVREAVERSGLTDKGAAWQMDVDPATLSRVTSGQSPSVETYLRMVRWLSADRSGGSCAASAGRR